MAGIRANMQELSMKDKNDYPQLTFEARPKHIRNSTMGRLDQFTGGHYAAQNLSSLLFAERVDDASAVTMEYWSAPGRTKPSFDEVKRVVGWKKAVKGLELGPSCKCTNHWFRISIKIPSTWSDYERIQFEFDSSSECLIFTTDGLPLQGLTGGFDNDRRVEFLIPEEGRKAGKYDFIIEASCNGMFGIDNMNPPDPNRYYRLNSADLVVPNMEAWRLMWDFQTLHQISQTLPQNSPLNQRSMYAANAIMNAFETGSLESVAAGRKIAEGVLGKDWEAELEKERAGTGKSGMEGRDSAGGLWGVGHCHIDTAWLWPFSVTQQKVARSWSTQVDLMNRYPEHRFSCTQAQQYKWLEQLYPLLFEEVKGKVAEGKFQPVGATWVEMDTNIPSGEALCRQFLYGQRYYESRFGSRSPTFVLPDTFGYSSQLPQIARLSGTKQFFTQKLSWNSINSFPHSTFNWVGLDGSQTLTHMTPVNNYNSQCNIDDIRNGVVGHKNLEVTSQSLLLFGNGDGGGGPTPPMLEKLRRARAVGKNPDCGGSDLPLVRMGGSIDEFFESVRKETLGGTTLPNWRGELYFELHRGTYTSHGSIKKGNRKSEILMREVEYAATLAALSDTTYVYPKDRIDSAWEDLLLCQFHDVLPGSGIAMIYEDAEIKYKGIRDAAAKMLEEAYKVLYKGSISLAAGEATTASGKGKVLAINTIPGGAPRQAVVPVSIVKHPKLKSTAVQLSNNKQTAFMLVESGKCDPVGTTRGLLADTPPVTISQVSPGTFAMANSSVSLKLEGGRITSLYDVAMDRELIPDGQTGGFVIFEDHPNYWDAWDVDTFHLEKAKHLSFTSLKIQEAGPLRATLLCEIEHGSSKISAEISLDAIPASLKADARSLIRFDSVVDWREKHQFLKFELPLDIHATDATFETQFGTVARPTHRNTSWDAAKFEVCGHKFADLSEYGYGVALLNDCKYGYAVEGNVMRLSLLRAPTMPDPECDMGVHEFSFAIYPHLGTYLESDVAQVAYAFNTPMTLRYMQEPVPSVAPLAKSSLFTVEGAPNLMLETIKRGEDDDFGPGTKQTIILRVFEQLGGHAKAKLRISGITVSSAHITNILEDNVEKLVLTSDVDDTLLDLSFRGYEVKTVKLTLKSAVKPPSSDDGFGGWVKIGSK